MLSSTVYDLNDNIFDLLTKEDQAPANAPSQLRRRKQGDEEAGAAAAVSHAAVFAPAATSPAAVLIEDPTDPSKDLWQLRLANACFLFIGIGVAIAWTSLRAGIAYFSSHFAAGAAFYNLLQVAYNVPVLPLLILQTLFDERFDAKYGSSRAYVFRLSISMVVMAGCLMIVIPRDQTLVLISAALVGVFDAVAFGTASQLFSMFPQACSGYYFIGSSLTSVVSIALTFATGFDKEEPSSGALTAFYVVAALFILMGLAAALTLIYSRIGRFYLDAKDDALAAAERAKVHGDAELSAARMAQLQGGGSNGKAAGGAGVDNRPLLASEDGSTAAAGTDGFLAVGGVAAAELAPPKTSNTDLLRYTLLCHIALFLCWTGTNTVDSMIAFVPSQSDTPAQDNQGFRLIMLYASLGGELLGKQLNLLRRGRILRGPKGLLVAVCIRTMMVLPFLLYILQPLYTAAGTFGFRVDGLIVTFQALFDASGAYFSSLSYGMAPALLPHPSLRAQSSTLLAITLMLGVYLGLGISLGIAHRLGDVPRDALA